MTFFYQLFIQLFVFGMKGLSLFNAKTKKGVEGRKQSLDTVKSVFSKEDQVIWMHAASLGEYEQGLPVLEKLKSEFPGHKILITFFSPSGYENVIKKKHIADAVCYLPFDKTQAVREFTAQFNTELFFTVKYDYWYHLMRELKNNGAKVFVISALFYEKQAFFRAYGKWFTKQLQIHVDWFFHQTFHSYILAKSIGLQNASVTGDTRFDRVKHLRNRDNHVDYIREFIGGKKSIVFGSSWQAEEKLAKSVSEKSSSLKLIIAPHDLKRVEHLKEIFPNAVLYSSFTNAQTVQNSDVQTLIIDSIGLLSKLYSYADIAVVGGGFHHSGLHNILEAATFGKPVLFGNLYRKNPEADGLIAAEGGKSFASEAQAAQFVGLLLRDKDLLEKMSANAQKFVASQPNSSELIVAKMLSF